MQRIVHVHTYKKLEVRFIHRADTLAFLNDYFTEIGVKVLDADFHAETDAKNDNIYTNVYTLVIPSGTSSAQIIAHLSEYKNIRAVYTRNV